MIRPCFKFCQSPFVILLGILSQRRFERICPIMSAPCSTIGYSSSFWDLLTLVAYFKNISRILTSSLQVHLSWRINDSISYVTRHLRRSVVYSLGCMFSERFGVNLEMKMFEKTICLLRICCKSSGLFSIRRLMSSTYMFWWMLNFSRVSIVS